MLITSKNGEISLTQADPFIIDILPFLMVQPTNWKGAKVRDGAHGRCSSLWQICVGPANTSASLELRAHPRTIYCSYAREAWLPRRPEDRHPGETRLS